MAPILVFVGLEICAQAFQATPREHHKAVAFSFLPIVAYLVLIQLQNLLRQIGQLAADLTGEMAITYQSILILGNGFIVTSLLWGSMLAMIIDRRLRNAAAYAGVAGLLTLFGVIHSPFENGHLFVPWAVASPIPLRFATAYGVVVGFLLLMDWTTRRDASASPL